jgi:hypothetical protein
VTDYTHATGATGTMMIRDTGTLVEFWLKAGSGTYNYQLPWSYTVNAVTSNGPKFRFETGGAYQKLGSWNVTYSQTVTFKLGASGTTGLGGPTTFNQAITRSSAPAAPTTPVITSISYSSLFATFTDGANNGATIDSRQLGYGTNPTTPSTIISSDGSTSITGLAPGRVYYIRARTHNSKGYSPWSTAKSVRTIGGARVKVDTEWKDAIPYVKVSGVWLPARPWVKHAGVWKETT